MENKENYHIGNFLWDCNEDIVKVKLLQQTVTNACRILRTVSRIWSYISILLFAFYGFYHGNQTSAWTVSYIIFGVCAAMLVANTVLLCLEGHAKHAEGVRRGILHAFHGVSAVLKLAMTCITVYGLVTLADVTSTAVRITLSILSVFWLGVTLTVDVLMLAVTVAFHKVKGIFEERKERLVTACENTARGVVNAAVDVAVRKNPVVKGAVWVARHIAPKRRKKLETPEDEPQALPEVSEPVERT